MAVPVPVQVPVDCWVYILDFVEPLRACALRCVSAQFRVAGDRSMHRPRVMPLPLPLGESGSDFLSKALHAFTDATAYVTRYSADEERTRRAGLEVSRRQVKLHTQPLAAMVVDAEMRFRFLEVLHVEVDDSAQLDPVLEATPSLRTLILDHTPLTSLAFFRHVPELRRFTSTARNFAPKSELHHLSRVRNLEFLGLSNPSLVGEPLSTLLEHVPRGLHEFTYYCSTLEELELLSLTLPKLKYVYCYFARHDSEMLELFPDLAALKTTAAVVAECNRTTLSLRELELMSRHIPVPDPTEAEVAELLCALAKCPELTCLDVRTRVNLADLGAVFELRHLTSLSLTSCSLSVGCEQLFAQLPNLHRVTLAGCVFDEEWSWSDFGAALSRTPTRDMVVRCSSRVHQISFDEICELLGSVRLGRLTAAVPQVTADQLAAANLPAAGNPMILHLQAHTDSTSVPPSPTLSNTS